MREFTELTIKRNNKFILDTMDYQVLIMLYKPLVGPHAIDLYLSLYELSYGEREVTKSIYYIKDIISDFDLTEDDLRKYLNFLKKIQLIKRNGIEIELYPPYSKTEFFELPLVDYLSYNTSPSQLRYLMNRFYGKVVDVEKPREYELAELEKKLNPKKRKNDYVPFSFDEFINSIDEEDIKEQLKLGREFFTSIAITYQFNLNDMLNVLYEADCDILFDKEKFISKAYEKHAKRVEKLNKGKKLTKTDSEYITYFETHTTNEVLGRSYALLSKADKSTLERMKDELNLRTPMINILIGYSRATNNNNLHPFAYYEKVVKDWREKGIDNVSDAYFHISELYNKSIEKTESNEEWVDNYFKKYLEEES